MFSSGDDPDDDDFDETEADLTPINSSNPASFPPPQNIDELNAWPESIKRRLKSEIDPLGQYSHYDANGKLKFIDFILEMYQIGYRKQSGWGPWNKHAALEIVGKKGATSLKKPQNIAQTGAASQTGESDYSNIGAE